MRTQKVDILLQVGKRWLEIFGLFLAFILPAGFQWFVLVLVCNLLCLYGYSDVGMVECPTTWLAGQFALMKYADQVLICLLYPWSGCSDLMTMYSNIYDQ